MEASRPLRTPFRSAARALGPCRRAVEARREAERREREAYERLELVVAFREQLKCL